MWGSWADSSGHVNLDELDYFCGYGMSFFGEEIYALDLSVTYTYFDYPQTNSDGDVQEIALGVAAPNLIKICDSALVPSYTGCYEWSGNQADD